MKTNPPNSYRLRDPIRFRQWASDDSYGMNGAFSIPLPGFGHRVIANCVVSDGREAPDGMGGYEHVSVHILEYGKQRVPTWAEMCAVKDIFWSPEEVVVQYHPAQSDYVNNHSKVLHLWKWTKGPFPTPNPLLVGIKELGVIE